MTAVRSVLKRNAKPRISYDGYGWICSGHGSRGNWAFGRGFTPREAYNWWCIGNL